MRYQVLPPLSDDEYAALKDDIRQNGVQIPVVEDEEGSLIDGVHRVRACEELRTEGVDVPAYPRVVLRGLTEAQKRSRARRLNLNRRHLDRAGKRRLIADQLRECPHWANNRVAKELAVSPHTVGIVRMELEETLQIAKFEELEGADGVRRPRAYRSPEEKARVRESWERLRRREDRMRLRKDLVRDREGDDEGLAKKHDTDAETVAKERETLRDEARRRGFDLVDRGLASVRRATGYHRRETATGLLSAFFGQAFGPALVRPDPEVDVEAVAEELAEKYVERERLREGKWRMGPGVEQLREKLKADREAAALLGRIVERVAEKVEEKIALEERFHEERPALNEDLDRFAEGEGPDEGGGE
jgi:ParB-like chromosome segregation protein Spo0J